MRQNIFSANWNSVLFSEAYGRTDNFGNDSTNVTRIDEQLGRPSMPDADKKNWLSLLRDSEQSRMDIEVATYL